MIEFKITIKQRQDGKVGFMCETTPGSATLREMDAAHDFMEAFKKFICQDGRTVIIHDWSGTNDPKKN